MLPCYIFRVSLRTSVEHTSSRTCVFVFLSSWISSRARAVLTRFCETRCLACRVSLLVFCCCLCSFVIHAQIEKCSQVIHDDRRTGSRAVLFLFAHIGKALRHLSSSGVTSRVVSCWILYWCCVPESWLTHRHRLVNAAKNKFVSAHVEPCELSLLLGPRTRSSAKLLGFLTHTL